MNRPNVFSRVAAVLAVALATPAVWADDIIVTFENGAQQSMSLKQSKAKIARIEFTSTGVAGPVGGDLRAGDRIPADAGRTAPGEGKEYKLPQGGRVTIALGELAFADRVVAYQPGNPGPRVESTKPACALGEPNYDGKADDTFVSLGKGGSLTLQFTKVAIVDGDGPDIQVFEIGPDVEATNLEVSADGRKWIDLGRISGGKASVDLHEKVGKGDRFSYVRLTDIKTRDSGKQTTGGGDVGPDIDAVAAINCVRR